MKHRLLQGAFLRITLSLFVLLATFMSLHAQGTDILDISAGATAASGSYAADKDFSGGTAAYTATTVTTTGVTNPAPEAVYQNQRYGNFTYTLPGFTSGTTYLVRLHMSEFYWTAAGKREFNVLINGTQVLTNFDIYATAGGEFKAVVEQFNAVANSSGNIVIQFVSVIDNAAISGIETESVTAAEGPYPGPSAPTLPGTVLAENYDTGGQGVAYNVTSTNGTANTYRSQGVDLEAASAPATGNDLGWSAAGQWFKYTVNASTAGTYTVSFLVASPTAITDAFHLSNSSGTNLTGSVAIPATGGYQTWVTVTATAALPAGTQTLTLNDDAAGWNIDSMAFATSTATVATPTFSPAAGTYTSSQSVTISDATSGATIYYTTNNTTPSSTSTKYTGPISVTASETIEAIAELSGDNNSAVATAAYTISASTEGPYPGPSAPTLPGTVLAANYDTGGQGVAYNVTSVNGTANCGGRTGSVDSGSSVGPCNWLRSWLDRRHPVVPLYSQCFRGRDVHGQLPGRLSDCYHRRLPSLQLVGNQLDRLGRSAGNRRLPNMGDGDGYRYTASGHADADAESGRSRLEHRLDGICVEYHRKSVPRPIRSDASRHGEGGKLRYRWPRSCLQRHLDQWDGEHLSVPRRRS